jgi:DNA-binding transcriptional ArsR family regulator
LPQRAANGRVGLKPTQERVLAVLADRGSSQLTRGEYEEIAGVSRSQAAYDLAELVEAEVLERVGGGRATRYRLVRRDHPGQRRWTTERIRADLDRFCGGRKTWPSATEFKAAGRADLYVAASRYGGIAFWATELGFARPGRATPPQARVSAWRPRLRWAAGGAALAGALFATAGAVVFAWNDSPAQAPQALHASSGGTAHANAPARTAARPPQHKAAQAKARANPKQTRTRTRTRQLTRPPTTQTSTPTYHTELAVQRDSPATGNASSTPRLESTRASSGPAPLAPPTGGGSGGPTPLPPPGQ